MSDEFEDISVEAESPVASGGTEAPVAVEGSAEPVGAEVEATQVNLAPADESLKQNSQQVYLEINAPERANSAAPITAAGQAAKEAEQEEKKATAAEHFAQQEKEAERRRELAENFGMSSHDLTKLLDFVANPELQEKLKSRLKNSMGEKRAEKAMAELNELHQLKKKQEKGEGLTPEEQARLAELRKSEDLKIVIQAAQEIQQRRNDRDLGTAGATTKSISEAVDGADAGDEGAKILNQKRVSFESYTDSGIVATELTGKYNVAATAANKNEPIVPHLPPAQVIAQNSAITQKAVEVGGTGFNV